MDQYQSVSLVSQPRTTIPQASNPTSQVINITPELANSLLQRNEMNRNLKVHQVAAYAAQMRQGNFKSMNGQTISIAGSLTTGKLIDGQHRLNAIIDAGVTLPFLVVTGLSNDVIPTIDTGAKRTVGDLFDMNGVTHGRNLSACISTYAKLCSRNDIEKVRKVDSGLVEYKLTPDAIYNMYFTMQKDADEVIEMSRDYWAKFRVLGPSQIGAMMLYTRLHSQFKDRADAEFWEPLFTGDRAIGMILVCRNLLIEELGLQKHKRSKPTELVNAIIKAYNTHFLTPTKMIKVSALTNNRTEKNYIFV